MHCLSHSWESDDEEDVAHDVWMLHAHSDDAFLGFDCAPLLQAMDQCKHGFSSLPFQCFSLNFFGIFLYRYTCI